MDINTNPEITDVYNTGVMRHIAEVLTTLSPALRKVAEYVLQHPMKTATMTIEDLAIETGTSVAAVNRFVRVINCGGFSGLKSELLSTLRNVLSPIDKLKKQVNDQQSSHKLKELLEIGVANLQIAKEINTEISFINAVEALIKANRLFTLGFGQSSHIAIAAASRLHPFFNSAISVNMVGDNENAAYHLTSIKPEDVLLVILLPRYSSDTLKLSRFASERGATIVAITDSPASPMQGLAHHLLFAASEHPTLPNSNVAALAIIEAIVATITIKNKEAIHISSKETENLLSRFYLPQQPDLSEKKRSSFKVNKKSNIINLPYALAIHGGAGTIIPGSSKEPQYLEALQQVIDTGEKILSKGGTAVEAVLACVIALEDCPLFNAGRGSAFTSTGTHEMDASIMNGQTLAVGAVAGVRTIRNPIYLAHVLMHHPNHNFLIGEGAELFARTCNDIAIVSPNYFYTAERMEQLKYVQSLSNEALLLDHDAAMQSTKFGTVGAVARDRFGQLAAATSTGGLTNKLLGRVGDTPLIGAGCYADSNTVAVSATGTGEAFIRAILAYDIAARIKYTHVSLEEATREVVLGKLTELGGQGGIIAIDKEGNISMPFNTKGMYRGWAKEGKGSAVAVGR